MRITDPAWPAVQEAARMMLREDQTSILVPKNLNDSVEELILKMGDTMPSRQTFPSVSHVGKDEIIFTMKDHTSPHFYCGLSTPLIGTLWIPFEASKIWNILRQAMFDLLDAGYPGCLGCGGKGSEAEWDEVASRTRMNLDFIV